MCSRVAGKRGESWLCVLCMCILCVYVCVSLTMCSFSFHNFITCSPTRSHSEGDKLVPTVQKNMSELAVGLLHLQQNIAIPEISLTFHPKIVETVKHCQDQGHRPTVEDLGASVTDTTFLNALQKNVGSWIKEIKKVNYCRQ